MIELELDVWWLDEEDSYLDELEIDINIEQTGIKRKHTFYNINFIRKAIDNPKFCVVNSGLEEWVVAHSYEYVKSAISKQLNLHKFN